MARKKWCDKWLAPQKCRKGYFSFACLSCTKLFHCSHQRKVFIYFLTSLALCLLFWDQAAGNYFVPSCKMSSKSKAVTLFSGRNVRPNSPSVLKIPLATNGQEWARHTKGTSRHNYLVLVCCWQQPETEFWLSWNFDWNESWNVWFKTFILVYLYDSSSLKIIWHFNPRNIPNNFRDICTTPLISCFLIALIESSSQRFQL